MIQIKLLIDASTIHCGRGCQYSLVSGGCQLFMGYYRRRSAEVGGRAGRHFERLAACIAAEKEAGK